MLHLASRAIVELMYPFTWAGVFIPILPARLIGALEAPCPYIVGIERRYEDVELPSDDIVLVDLDENEIQSTGPPVYLPKHERRKLQSLLQQAAPHHNRFGVQPGPVAYAVEAFPWNAFSSENTSVFTTSAQPTTLAKYAGLNSAAFGTSDSGFSKRLPIFNAFLRSRDSRGSDRPLTSSTKDSPPPSLSPTQSQFSPQTPLSRNDSGFSLQATLREKRSGHFDNLSRRSSSFNMDRRPTIRRPSAPFAVNGHSTSPSVSTISTESFGSNYAPSIAAPSTYAQSTLAASTIMPQALYQPVQNRDGTCWVEGHCLIWRPHEENVTCTVCEEKAEDGVYRCNGCFMHAHGRCAQQIGLVCPAAFYPDQIRAAFVRCFASLLYTYRKFLSPTTGESKKSGLLFKFNQEAFKRSLPHENAEYVAMLHETQGEWSFHFDGSNLLTGPQLSMNSSTSARRRPRTIRPSCYSTRSSLRSAIAANTLSSASPRSTSSPTHPTTCGDRRQPMLRVDGFRGITWLPLREVSRSRRCEYLVDADRSSPRKTGSQSDEGAASHAGSASPQHRQGKAQAHPEHART